MDQILEDRIIELRTRKVPRVEIAQRCGVREDAIQRLLERRGINRNRYTKMQGSHHDVMTALQNGMTHRGAAAKFGCSTRTISRIQDSFGQNRPPAPRVESRKRFSLEDRIEIQAAIKSKESNVVIANRLGFHPSSVGREVSRCGGREHYRAVTADIDAQARTHRPKDFKLALLADVRAYVEEKLSIVCEHFWSPRQIADGIKKNFATDRHKWVSHETIYRSLYIQARSHLRADLKASLRTGRTSRKASGQIVGRGRISEMVNIAERPADVADRAVPGHWEGDLIIGEASASAIATLVERTTRYVMLVKVPNKTTAAVTAAIAKKIIDLPTQLRRSLTWDQGVELAAHKDFTVATDVSVYFCDPHSPWQRGTNENTNGLLRQYFPKGTNLSVHDQERLDFVASRLNTRPRETLGFRTPGELFAELIDQPPGV